MKLRCDDRLLKLFMGEGVLLQEPPKTIVSLKGNVIVPNAKYRKYFVWGKENAFKYVFKKGYAKNSNIGSRES